MSPFFILRAICVYLEFTSVGLAEDRGVRVRVDVAGGPGQQRDPGGGVVRARLLLT